MLVYGILHLMFSVSGQRQLLHASFRTSTVYCLQDCISISSWTCSYLLISMVIFRVAVWVVCWGVKITSMGNSFTKGQNNATHIAALHQSHGCCIYPNRSLFGVGFLHALDFAFCSLGYVHQLIERPTKFIVFSF